MPNQRQSVSLLTWPQRALLFYFSPARSLLQLRPFHLHSPWSHQVVSTAATMSTKNASTLGAAKITGTANGSTAPPTNINNTTATTINTTTSALPGKKVLSGRVYFIPGGYSKLGQVIRGTTLTNDRKRPLVEDEVVEIGSSSSSKSTPDGPPAAKVQVKKEIKKETKREVKNEIKREVKKVIIVRSSPAPFLPQTAQQQLQSTVVQARTQTPVRRLVHMSAPIQRFTIPFTQAFTANSKSQNTQNLNQTFTPPSTQTFTSPSTQTFTPPFTQTFAPSFTPNFPSTPTPPLVPFQSGLYRLPLNQLYEPVQTPFKVPTAPAKKTLHYSIARQQKILQAFKETLGVTPPGYSPTIGSASDGPSGSGGGCSSSSDNKNGKWIFQRMADFVKDVEKFKLSVCQLLDPGQVSVTLKTGSWLEALILRSCWYSHKSAEVKRELFPNSRQPVYFDPECHYQIALRPDGDTPTNAAFLRKMDDFMQVLAQLQLDETELSLLTAWLIFEDQPFECNCFPAVKVDEDAEEQLFLTAHQQPSTVSPNVPQVNLKQTIHVLLYEYQAKAMKSTAGGSGASSSTSMPMSNTYRTMNVLLAIAELAGISFLLEV